MSYRVAILLSCGSCLLGGAPRAHARQTEPVRSSVTGWMVLPRVSPTWGRVLAASTAVLAPVLVAVLRAGLDRRSIGRETPPARGPAERELTVVTHNVMRGFTIDKLLATYRQLQTRAGLGLLLLQEAEAKHGEKVAQALGPPGAFRHVTREGLSIIYDARRFRLRGEPELVELPLVEKLEGFEKIYVNRNGGKPEQRFALVGVLDPVDGGEPVVVANFHLDAAGKNTHRRRQLDAVVARLKERGLVHRIIAAGDTNAFVFGRARSQLAILRDMLGPLRELGVEEPDLRPTHAFAFSLDPTVVHKFGRALGFVSLDLRHKFDVLATSLEIVDQAVLRTVLSDHFLVLKSVRY